MKAYKLFRVRKKDNTLGSLFINRTQVIELGKWYEAEEHPTKGYAYRPGWHVCKEPKAPHLSTKGRVWAEVEIKDYTEHVRPENQGGLWYTAKQMKVLRLLTSEEIPQ